MIADFRRTRSWLVVPALGLFALVAAATLTTAVSCAAVPQTAPQPQPDPAAKKSDADYIRDLDSKDVAVRDAATEALVNPHRYYKALGLKTLPKGCYVYRMDGFAKELIAQLQDSLAQAGPIGQFRARFVMVWLSQYVTGPDGSSLISRAVHYLPDKGLDAVEARKARYYLGDEGHDALLAAVHYLEDHMNDGSVAKFAPQERFSYVSIQTPDEDSQWHFVIQNMVGGMPLQPALEKISPSPYDYMRDLTLYYDPQKKEIVKAENGKYTSKEAYDADMSKQWAEVRAMMPPQPSKKEQDAEIKREIATHEAIVKSLKTYLNHPPTTAPAAVPADAPAKP